MVIMPKFNMTRMMQTIVEFQCDELWLVPRAAPLAEQVIVQLEKRFPKVSIRQAWGMTETTSCLTVTPSDVATWSNATKVGKLVPGTEIRVVDPETERDVPRGQIGEVRGHAVAPAELEDLLHGHPKVRDVAIIGIPDDYSGEIPRAFIVLRPGMDKDSEIERELQDFVTSRKAKHKRLAGGVEFVSEIPKSASGKILRRMLKNYWKQHQTVQDGRHAKL
ncbi:hypothetical protein NW754_009633 [Fusarium falciforme]|nr:hypothetical protein NW754_009633 [Fusarium falciforme]